MIYLSVCKTKDAQNPNGSIEIIFTGLHPVERFYEESIIGEYNVKKTHHPSIMQVIEHSFPLRGLEIVLSELAEKYNAVCLKQ
nr:MULTISPECIES: hypothetical protein [unclassified Psychrobacter]